MTQARQWWEDWREPLPTPWVAGDLQLPVTLSVTAGAHAGLGVSCLRHAE